MIRVGEAIKPDGTTLSQAEYDLLLENRLPWTGRLVMEKLTPVFDWDPDLYFTGVGRPDNVAHDVTYIPSNDSLLRVFVDTDGNIKSQVGVASYPYSGGARAWSSPVTIGAADGTVRPAVWTSITWPSTSTTYLAYWNGTSIMWTSTTLGVTWATPENITSSAFVSGLAIPGFHRGFPAVIWSEYYPSPSYYSSFRVFYKDTTWQEVSFTNRFPFQITGLAGIHKDIYHNEWVIVFSGDDPPLLSKRSIGGVTQQVGYRRGGLRVATWNAYAERLSDPRKIDVIDEFSAYNFRRHPRITRWYGDGVQGSFLITARTQDGMQRNNWADADEWGGISLYWSDDGDSWTNNFLVRGRSVDPGTTTRSVPAVLNPIVTRNGTFLCSASQLFRAYSTALTAGEESETYVDVALDSVSSVGWNAAQMDQMSLQMEDTGEMQGLLEQPGITLAKFYMGVQDGTSEVLSLVKTMIVDSVRRSWRADSETFTVTLRDHLSFWTDLEQDNTVELVGTTLGRDDFKDLGHTAWQDGSGFTIESERLRCTANPDADRGVVFFTWRTDITDGIFKIAFMLDSTDTGIQSAGLVLRGYNKDDFLSLRYTFDGAGVNFAHDRFYYVERNSGTESYMMQVGSGTMGWARGTWYHIMLRIRGQTANVFYSTSGTAWTLLASFVCPSYPQLAGPVDVLTTVPKLTGAFGVDAKNSVQDKYVEFDWLHITDGAPFYTLEDVIKELGPKGYITKYRFNSARQSIPNASGANTIDDFTVASGTWAVYSPTWPPNYYLRGEDTGSGRRIIWLNGDTPDNFTVTFRRYGYSWGVLLRATDTTDWFEVGGDSTHHWIRVSVAGSETYYSRIPEQLGLHCNIKVVVQEVKYDYSSADPEWLFILVYAENRLINATAAPLSAGRPPNRLGFCQYAPDVIDYGQIRIPELYDQIRYASLDASSPAMMAIQQAIAQRDVDMHVRFDGTLWIYRNKNKADSVVSDLDLVEEIQTAWDKRHHGTHLRMVGAFLTLDHYDLERINQGGGNRMVSFHNPDLMSPEDIDYELRRLKYKVREQAELTQLKLRAHPFIEPGDLVESPGIPVSYGQGWIVEAIDRTITAGNMQMVAQCRVYDTLRDSEQSGLKP